MNVCLRPTSTLYLCWFLLQSLEKSHINTENIEKIKKKTNIIAQLSAWHLVLIASTPANVLLQMKMDFSSLKFATFTKFNTSYLHPLCCFFYHYYLIEVDALILFAFWFISEGFSQKFKRKMCKNTICSLPWSKQLKKKMTRDWKVKRTEADGELAQGLQGLHAYKAAWLDEAVRINRGENHWQSRRSIWLPLTPAAHTYHMQSAQPPVLNGALIWVIDWADHS